VPFSAIRSCLDPDDELGDQEFVVTEAIVGLVGQWCTVGPALLVLDDLQWADPLSMVVLNRLARAVDHLPLVVVAAYRPAPRARGFDGLLSALDGSGAALLPLGGLPGPTVVALVEQLAGAPLAPALLDLVACADGNPRDIHDLVRGLPLRIVDGTATVAEGTDVLRPLGAVLARRLDVLSQQARQVLRMAAVLVPGFTLSELSTVLGTPVMAMWEIVNEAMGARLLTHDGDRLVFRYELIRQVLADEVPVGVPRALRRSAARALASADAPVERVAQYLLAGDELDADAAAWLDREADQLIARAPCLAADLFERVPAAWLHLAVAQLHADRPAGAERTIRSALAAGSYAGSGPFLRWLLVQACAGQGHVEQAITEAERALTADALASGMRGLLYGFVVQHLLLLGRVEGADAVAARALRDAGTDNGYGTACDLYVQAGVRLAERRPHDGLDLVDRVLAASGFAETPLTPHLIRGFCLLCLDRLAEAESAFETGMRDPDPGQLIWYRLGRARIRYLDGRWDEALAEIDAGLRTADPFGVAPELHSHAALIATHRGNTTAYPELPDESDASLAGRIWGVVRVEARALAREQQGPPARALQLLLDHQDDGIEVLGPDLARLAASVGAADKARSVARALDTLSAARPTPTLRGTAMLCRGVADEDTSVLFAAAHEYQAGGRPLYEGYAYEIAAAFLAQQGRPAEAHSALDLALDRYSRLGAASDAERATSRLRRAGLRRRARSRPRTGWSALTEAERKVAILVAAGRSGADIATELHLSRRTVQSRVSRILNKLSLSSRVELVGTVPDGTAEPPSEPIQNHQFVK
jgi:DNA-binding CsgD family transcriptional regulator